MPKPKTKAQKLKLQRAKARMRRAKAKRAKEAKKRRFSKTIINRRPMWVCGGTKCRRPTKAQLRRPSPTASATGYPVGYQKLGKDGRQWRIIRSSAGVKRWSRVSLV